MEQLLKVTTTPFQAIRFTQSARLVPTDSVELERRKAMARYAAFQLRNSGGSGNMDLKYINQVNSAFTSESPSNRFPVTVRNAARKMDIIPHSAPESTISKQSGAPVSSTANGSASESGESQHSPEGARTIPLRHSYQPSEFQAAYTAQRGSFEMRVAKGDLSVVPPLAMTIITQYPSIQFEYVGGFNYVPPSMDPAGDNMNLSI